jgi:hypothetical protein
VVAGSLAVAGIPPISTDPIDREQSMRVELELVASRRTTK